MTESRASTESPGVDAAVVATERPSFRAVFDAEHGYVWNTLRRLGVREADLKDQCQEVFIVTSALLPDYDPSRPLRPWLFGIAYRIALRYRALARHRRESFDEVPDRADSAPRADEQVEAAQRRALVLEAIASIELPKRAVFVMTEIDGATTPEIAEALAIPLNTAYSRLRLAREEFAAAVQRIRAQGRLS
jgi:RNA polymerase sigma-70 factor (ECF subfamily)